jgi:hypothetical protein
MCPTQEPSPPSIVEANGYSSRLRPAMLGTSASAAGLLAAESRESIFYAATCISGGKRYQGIRYRPLRGSLILVLFV